MTTFGITQQFKRALFQNFPFVSLLTLFKALFGGKVSAVQTGDRGLLIRLDFIYFSSVVILDLQL